LYFLKLLQNETSMPEKNVPMVEFRGLVKKNVVHFSANRFPTSMKFQWNSVNHINEELHKFCVELEYKLRPRITRFLISRLEKETSGDFSNFYFDIDLNLGQISISDKTPRKFRKKIGKEFDHEINHLFVRRFFEMNSPATY